MPGVSSGLPARGHITTEFSRRLAVSQQQQQQQQQQPAEFSDSATASPTLVDDGAISAAAAVGSEVVGEEGGAAVVSKGNVPGRAVIVSAGQRGMGELPPPPAVGTLGEELSGGRVAAVLPASSSSVGISAAAAAGGAKRAREEGEGGVVPSFVPPTITAAAAADGYSTLPPHCTLVSTSQELRVAIAALHRRLVDSHYSSSSSVSASTATAFMSTPPPLHPPHLAVSVYFDMETPSSSASRRSDNSSGGPRVVGATAAATASRAAAAAASASKRAARAAALPRGRVGLIVLATRDRGVLLIDPLACSGGGGGVRGSSQEGGEDSARVDALRPLSALLLDPRVVKVMHAGSAAVMWLQADFGLHVVNVFDTFVALDEAFLAGTSPLGGRKGGGGGLDQLRFTDSFAVEAAAAFAPAAADITSTSTSITSTASTTSTSTSRAPLQSPPTDHGDSAFGGSSSSNGAGATAMRVPPPATQDGYTHGIIAAGRITAQLKSLSAACVSLFSTSSSAGAATASTTVSLVVSPTEAEVISPSIRDGDGSATATSSSPSASAVAAHSWCIRPLPSAMLQRVAGDAQRLLPLADALWSRAIDQCRGDYVGGGGGRTSPLSGGAGDAANTISTASWKLGVEVAAASTSHVVSGGDGGGGIEGVLSSLRVLVEQHAGVPSSAAPSPTVHALNHPTPPSHLYDAEGLRSFRRLLRHPPPASPSPNVRASSSSTQQSSLSPCESLLTTAATTEGVNTPSHPSPTPTVTAAVASLRRTLLRSHLQCLRVPPYDCHHGGGALAVPQTTPPWYSSCRVCGRGGHYTWECGGSRGSGW